MLNVRYSTALFSLLAVISFARESAAAGSCAAYAQSLAMGNLVNLRDGSAIPPFGASSKVPSLQLAYGVAWAPGETGAMVVKIRHRWPEATPRKNNEAFPGKSLIHLERSKYVSPCTNAAKEPYNRNVPLQEYVDQHYYGLRRSSMDEFHADVGVRHRTGPFLFFWTRETEYCKRTFDTSTRGRFLYSDDGRIATESEVTERRFAEVRQQAGFVGTAFAGETEQYKDQLSTKILPYRKEDSNPCVSFKVDVPRGVDTTDVEMLDADVGFSRKWQIKWEQN